MPSTEKLSEDQGPIAWGLRIVLQTGPKMPPRMCHWPIPSTEHVVCYVVCEANTGPAPGNTDSITQIGSYFLHASDCNTWGDHIISE